MKPPPSLCLNSSFRTNLRSFARFALYSKKRVKGKKHFAVKKKFLLFVNEEVNLFIKDYAVKIATLQSSIEEKRGRKFYNTIETGTLNYSDVAPRIKELNDEVDLLTAEIQEIESQETQQDPIILNDEELRPYVLDLKETLMKGSIVERKSFMRTFVKEIRVDYPRLEVEYTIPLPIPKQRNPLNRGGSLYVPDW